MCSKYILRVNNGKIETSSSTNMKNKNELKKNLIITMVDNFYDKWNVFKKFQQLYNKWTEYGVVDMRPKQKLTKVCRMLYSIECKTAFRELQKKK